MKLYDPKKLCTYCGGPHDVKICPKTYSGSAKRLHLRCTYCGAHDHDYDSCTKHG